MHRYVVAGVALSVPCTVDVLDSGGFADAEVTVELCARPPDAAATWHRLPTAAEVHLRDDGRRARVIGDHLDPATARAIAAFSSGVQQRPVLHAAGILLGGRVALFVGPSGVGKSTLAATFAGAGAVVIGDDLVPCRLGGDGRPYVPWRDRQLAVSAVHYPRRVEGLRTVQRSQLSPRAALEQLLRNGFGEVPVAAAWRAQVELYSVLARTVPAFELGLPDDLALVEDAVQALAAALS